MSSEGQYTLLNVKEFHEKFPYTFYAPSEKILTSIKTGDLVKVIFCRPSKTAPGQEDREWMWVELKHISGQNFMGILANESEIGLGLTFYDEISFTKDNIVCVKSAIGEEETKEFERLYKTKLCYISKEVFEKRNPILYIENVDFADGEKPFSIWVFEAGTETEPFKVENYVRGSLGAALNIDDSFKELLSANPRNAFRRSSRSVPFEPTEALLSSPVNE